MGLFSSKDRLFARAVSKMAFCNPFLPERIEYEKEALGDQYHKRDLVWSKIADTPGQNPNIEILEHKSEKVAETALVHLNERQVTDEDLRLYEELVLYLLYNRYSPEFDAIIESVPDEKKPKRIPFYQSFMREWHHYFTHESLPDESEAVQVFSSLFLIRRAFHQIYHSIFGSSLPAAKLRAAVWQSIFTHDMRRFRRTLFNRMGDITCLITGPSGTGKELVARAIGGSRFIPFNPDTETFTEDFSTSFYALNLSALSPTLIESELFGHQKGSFTGAIQDRIGWLEKCPCLGTVFLDEIGELDVSIQVKLLRVVQNRVFQRLGDIEDHHFAGKLIAATNQDLSQQMEQGRFRQDLYYRLCSDIIRTPSLREQIEDNPEVLVDLLLHVSRNLVGENEAGFLADESHQWIMENLGPEYEWRGNFRELEQCVRNLLIRKVYTPVRRTKNSPTLALAEEMRSGALTADELLRRYCVLVYQQTGTYQETARRLGLDHRTVKSKIIASDRLSQDDNQGGS